MHNKDTCTSFSLKCCLYIGLQHSFLVVLIISTNIIEGVHWLPITTSIPFLGLLISACTAMPSNVSLN